MILGNHPYHPSRMDDSSMGVLKAYTDAVKLVSNYTWHVISSAEYCFGILPGNVCTKMWAGLRSLRYTFASYSSFVSPGQ